jgi:hypothetical protein
MQTKRGVGRPHDGEVGAQEKGREVCMYIGVGTIVLILIIVLLIAFVF